jgi:hypothetical protein
MAAIGKQLKQSVNVFQSLILYRLLPVTSWMLEPNLSIANTRLIGLLTFIIKSIDTVYASAFVVSSQNEEVFGIFDLVSKQQTYSF